MKETKNVLDAVPFPLEMVQAPKLYDDDSDDFPIMDNWKDIFTAMNIDEQKRKKLELDISYINEYQEISIIMGTTELVWYWREDDLLKDFEKWDVDLYTFRNYISSKNKGNRVFKNDAFNVRVVNIQHLLARKSK